MNILVLTLLFAFAGSLGVVFHRLVPDGDTIKQRFPLRGRGLSDIVLPIGVLAIGITLWLETSGPDRLIAFQSFVIALLVLESGFLLLMRRLRSTVVLSAASAVLGLVAYGLSWYVRQPIIDVLLFVFGTLGAWTLALLLGFLRVPFLMIIVLGLTVIDYYHITSLATTVSQGPTTAGEQSLLLVSIGSESLGFGDFIFLSLCTLVLIAKFGHRTALVFLTSSRTSWP